MTSGRPKWSVMIPAYNGAEYLKKTLDSVLAQDEGIGFMQIEVIDDASEKDDLERLVNEVGKGRVQYYRKQKNEGATKNFNTCIERSKGRLVHILHGDDWLLPGFYRCINKMVEDNENCSLYATRAFYANQEGILEGMTPRLIEFEKKVSNNIKSFYPAGPHLQFAGVVIKRSFYEKYGGFDPELVHVADADMWARAISLGGGRVSAEVLAVYRMFDGNDSGRLAKSAENLYDRERLFKKMAIRDSEYNLEKAKDLNVNLAKKQELKFQNRGDEVSARNNRRFWMENSPWSSIIKEYTSRFYEKLKKFSWHKIIELKNKTTSFLKMLMRIKKVYLESRVLGMTEKCIEGKNYQSCPLCMGFGSKIVNGDGWKIIKCNGCGNARTEPPPSAYDYENNDFHSDAIHENVNQEESLEKLPLQWRESIFQQVNHIKKLVNKEDLILEIGCGEGLLLNELKVAGFNVCGIEPSKSASERARQRRLNVITGEFPNEKLTSSYDLVVLSHVLEHLPDPSLIIEEIKKVAPGGILYLVQANYTGIIPVIEGVKWYAWMPSQHFWHFTPEGLKVFCGSKQLNYINHETSTLVHPAKWWWVQRLAKIWPSILDQFHIAFRMP